MTNTAVSSAAFAAEPLPAAPTASATTDALVHAARIILPHLDRDQRVDAPTLRVAMKSAYCGSDAGGAWDWKTAYDSCEAATVLFLRKFGPALQARAVSPAALLPMLAKIAGLLPTHTRRSEESQALQQFSTPITLGLAASAAAAITPADFVLEPSAGTGLLAILAEFAGGSLVLNELAETRAGLLGWAKKLIEKKPFKLVAVALANKMARIAFAILRSKTVYREIPAERASVGFAAGLNKSRAAKESRVTKR